MKTLSKVLCLLMVAVMCMSFFGASASALSFNIGGSGSSGSGISFPIGAIGDDEEEVASTPAPTPASTVDTKFGAGEPDVVDDEGFNAELDLDAEDNTEAVAAVAKAIADGQTVIKFNGAFSFEGQTLEITKDVTFSIAKDTDFVGADNIKVMKGATLSITGSGNIDELPDTSDGGNLVIYGGLFDIGVDPTAYVAEGYKVEMVDGVYPKVVKDTDPVTETKDDEEPEDKEIAVYTGADQSKVLLQLYNADYVIGSDESVTASYDYLDTAIGNLNFYFVVSTTARVVNPEDILRPDIDYTVSHAASGDSIVYLKNTFLDKLGEGIYYFGGGLYDTQGKFVEGSDRYADPNLRITKQTAPTTGDTSGGLKVTVFEKKYVANGGWESGDGALHFYCKYNGSTNIDLQLLRLEIDDKKLGNEMWYDQGDGYFYVGESQYLNELSKGVHTLKVYAKDSKGTVYSGTCYFQVLQDPAPVLEFSSTYKHVINSGKSLKLKSSEPIAAVYAGKNGTRLDNFDYTMYKLSSDGKTLTLTPEFLNARTAGYSYALWVEDASGNESNTVYFQILTTAQANASVDTGDASDIALWAAFLILSGAAVAVALPKVKKNGGKE